MTDLLLRAFVAPGRQASPIADWLATTLRRLKAFRRLLAQRRYNSQRVLWRHMADADENVQRDLGVDGRKMRTYDWMADLMRQ